MTPPLPDAASGPESAWRTRLRVLPVFPAELPEFDPDAAPDDPMDLAETWLDEAIDAGLLQPHVATLSTVDAAGAPSSRALLLKDLDAEGFWFATPSDSPAGQDLAGNPAASLHLYWRELGRQLRVTGPATPASPEVSLADWSARSPAARAESNPATWTAYRLRPEAIEFFAASPDRSHLRLRYRRDSGDDIWSRERLGL